MELREEDIVNGKEVYNDWKIFIDEISNNVYRIQLINKKGNEVEYTDHEFMRCVKKCIEYAKEIDEKLNK